MAQTPTNARGIITPNTSILRTTSPLENNSHLYVTTCFTLIPSSPAVSAELRHHRRTTTANSSLQLASRAYHVSQLDPQNNTTIEEQPSLRYNSYWKQMPSVPAVRKTLEVAEAIHATARHILDRPATTSYHLFVWAVAPVEKYLSMRKASILGRKSHSVNHYISLSSMMWYIWIKRGTAAAAEKKDQLSTGREGLYQIEKDRVDIECHEQALHKSVFGAG